LNEDTKGSFIIRLFEKLSKATLDIKWNKTLQWLWF